MNSNLDKAIEINHIYYAYNKDVEIFKDFSLDLYDKRFTAITGCNGSGKSTLSKLIMGILRPSSGNIMIFNENTASMTLGQRGKQIGYLFQNPSKQLFAPTVYEELSFVLEIKGFDKKIIEGKVTDILNLFEMTHLREIYPYQLSGGERQCLALAAVLINEPKYIILDEPTTSLDIKRKALLSEIIQSLKRKNIGMMVISHDESFVQRHADRMVGIEGGRIAFDTQFDT